MRRKKRITMHLTKKLFIPYFECQHKKPIDKTLQGNYIVNMANISFEWDEGKRALNKKKHGVCHCYRKNDEVIRIISVRKATRSEQKQYWERW